MAQTATIDDVTIIGSAQWPEKAGVEPAIQEFTIATEFSEQLQRKGDALQPVTLTIIDRDPTGFNPDRIHEWQNLFVIDISPGDNPFQDKVTLADLRYWWSYVHIYKVYNERRRIATRRRGRFNEELQQDIVEQLTFRAASIKDNGEPHNARDILEDILFGDDGLVNQPLMNVTTDVFSGDVDTDILDQVYEDVYIDDDGQQAVSIALSYAPGLNITVSKFGRVRVYSELSGRERDALGEGKIGDEGAAGPEIIGAGHVRVVSNSIVRPREVHCLFNRQCELRFDFREDGFRPGTTVVGEPPERFIENVLPVPDFELTLATGEIVYLGTYITIEQAIEAWGTPPGSIVTFGSPTDNYLAIRRAFIPEADLWSALALTGSLDLSGIKADWAARIGALRAHYRQTYRIPKDWIDNIRNLEAVLVATIDPTNAQRAPARAFGDYAIRPSMKAMFIEANRSKDRLFYAFNVAGYPGVDGEITDETKPMPAAIEILDQDQGIIRINLQLDPFANEEMVFPSKIENMPEQRSMRKSYSDTPIFFNAVTFDGLALTRGNVPALASQHAVAALLSAMPAFPNSKRQLHRVIVKPRDIASRLPETARAELNRANGPIMEVRIGSNIENARIRWKDTDGAPGLIERCFGRGGDPPNREELKDLTINDVESDEIPEQSAASLIEISKAAAASVYAGFFDRIEGSMTGRMNSDIGIVGAIDTITHQLQSGKARSHYSIKPRLNIPSMFSFLDDSTRQFLLKQIQP